MDKISNLIKITFITILFFFIFDFFFGQKILKKTGIIYLEDLLRVPNKNYSYSFKQNINTDFAVWGNNYYKLCTDSRGFKFNCKDKEKKIYNIAFIGDSFTEGIGLPYEKTFVGKLKEKKNLDVVNLGVASYSTEIYLQKIKYLISKNIISINHLIIGIDLTDLEDDWARREKLKLKKSINKNSKSTNLNFKRFLAQYFPGTYLILKKVNWYIKIHITKNENVEHLDYKKNKASWSYIKNYENLNSKIENQISTMDKLYIFLEQNNIKMSLLIYPHQASIKFDKKNSLYKKIWKNYCINKCFKFIDAYSIFFDEMRNNSKNDLMKKYFINGDAHFNENGNELIYKILNKNFENNHEQ